MDKSVLCLFAVYVIEVWGEEKAANTCICMLCKMFYLNCYFVVVVVVYIKHEYFEYNFLTFFINI